MIVSFVRIPPLHRSAYGRNTGTRGAGPRRFARSGSSTVAGLGLTIGVQHITATEQQLTQRTHASGSAVIELSLAPAPGGAPGN